MSPQELRDIGAQIVLGNTFHLWLRPGLEVIAAHGGLHRFMGWTAPSSPTPADFRCSASARCARSRAAAWNFVRR
jgi:tRNA-guanine family transglycosylase